MRQTLWGLAGLILLLLCSSFQTASAAGSDKPFVVIVKVEGKGHAKIRSHTGTERVAAERDHVYVDDRIQTDGDSTVDILLRDGSLVRVGLNTEYKLTSQKMDPKKNILTWIFELTKGSIRGFIEKSPDHKTTKFKVNTPSATMGVRGTQFFLEYSEKDKLTKLFTIEGVVFFGDLNCDLKNTCVDIKKGFMSKQKSGEKVLPPREYTKKELITGSDPDHPSSGDPTTDKKNAAALLDEREALLGGAAAAESGVAAAEAANGNFDAQLKEALNDFHKEQAAILGLKADASASGGGSASGSAGDSSSASGSSSPGSSNGSSGTSGSSSGGGGGSGGGSGGSGSSNSGSNAGGSDSFSNSGSNSGSSSGGRNGDSGSGGQQGSTTSGNSGYNSSAQDYINATKGINLMTPVKQDVQNISGQIDCIYDGKCPISVSNISTKTSTSTSTSQDKDQDHHTDNINNSLCTKNVCTSVFVCRDSDPVPPGGVCHNPGTTNECQQVPTTCTKPPM